MSCHRAVRRESFSKIDEVANVRIPTTSAAEHPVRILAKHEDRAGRPDRYRGRRRLSILKKTGGLISMKDASDSYLDHLTHRSLVEAHERQTPSSVPQSGVLRRPGDDNFGFCGIPVREPPTVDAGAPDMMMCASRHQANCESQSR